MKRCFIFQEGNSNKFWNIDIEGCGFTVTYGKRGTAGQTSVKSFDTEIMCQAAAAKLVAEKAKKGYIESGSDIMRDENNKKTFQCMSGEEANRIFGIDNLTGGSFLRSLYEPYLLVYDGDLLIDLGESGNFSIEEEWDFSEPESLSRLGIALENIIMVQDGQQTKLTRDILAQLPDHQKYAYGLYVNGNLTVKGNIFNDNCDGGMSLLVKGNLEANNLIIGGSWVGIHGKTTLRNVILGFYNHGASYFPGSVKAGYIINLDGYLDIKEFEGLVIDDKDTFAEPDYSVEDFFGRGRDGDDIGFEDVIKIVLKKDLTQKAEKAAQKREKAIQKLIEAIDKAKKDGKTSLNLSKKLIGVQNWPDNLFTMTELQELDLSENRMTRLDKRLSALPKLTKLNLSKNSLRELDDVLFDMTQLQELDIGKNNKLTQLDERIGKLVNLETLGLEWLQISELPESLGGLVNLKALDLSLVPVLFSNHILTWS
ncbi:MAG: WGR domain-containing protein [Peptococcaceae bacterium]|nr:WGR domain-containing protein [Peptococcaceae bacterium]